MTNSIIRSSDLDQVEAIYCHPSVLKEIEKQVGESVGSQEGIFNMYAVPIITNELIPPTKVVDGKYDRVDDVVPDDKFCTLVDIDNPPEWAIYFGLVKERVVTNIVMMKKRYYAHNPAEIRRPKWDSRGWPLEINKGL